MKSNYTLVFAAIIFALSFGATQSDAKTGAKKAKAPSAAPRVVAQQAAKSWLALVDAGKYGESWSAAASGFQSAVTREQWISAAQSVRDPLGKVLSRKLKSAQYTKTIPNAPPGEYVVIAYDTIFEKKGASVETIVPMRDKDGKWKVSGYFIK